MPAAIGAIHVLDAKTIEDLNLVGGVELDAGVRPLGNAKLDVGFQVADFSAVDQIRCLSPWGR